MNDFDVMCLQRDKWCRERAGAGLAKPTLGEMSAYHRAFLDALDVALCRTIAAERDAARDGLKEEK